MSLRSRNKVRGPFEPGATGGLSYLSGKTLDKCFREATRAVLFGLGSCRPENVPLKREELFEFISKATRIESRHAQNLLQQVSSEVPEQALDVHVIKAENVAESGTGVNTCAKIYLVSLHSAGSRQTGTPEPSTPRAVTKIQEGNLNPSYDQRFTLELESVEDIGLLIEIWGYPGSGKQAPPAQEEGVFKRLMSRLSSQASMEEGLLASILLPLHHMNPADETKWYSMKSQRNVTTRCHLRLSFVPNKASVEAAQNGERGESGEEAVTQYRVLARVFLDYQLARAREKGEEFVSTDVSWFKWSHAAGDVLGRYCQQHHITKLQQMALTVEAIAQMHRCEPLPAKALIHFCQQLQDTFSCMEHSTSQERAQVKHCLLDLVNFVFGRFSVSVELFPPHANHQLQEISQFVHMLRDLQQSDIWTTFIPEKSTADIADQARTTMQVRVKAWYLASVEFSMGFCTELTGLVTVSQKMVTVLSSFLVCFQTINKSYFDLFDGFSLSYDEVCLHYFHSLLISDLSKFTRLASSTLEKSMREESLSIKNRQLLSTACILLQKLFTLTFQVQQKLQERDDIEKLEMKDCHEYFERLIPIWMKQLRLQAEDQVYASLAQEKLLIVSPSSPNMLASAEIVISYIDQLQVSWQAVCQWPEPVIAFLASARILDVTADIVRLYIQQMTRAIPSWHLRKETTMRALGRKVCLALRAMASFSLLLSEPPAWLDWPTTVARLKSQTPPGTETTRGLTSSTSAFNIASNLSSRETGLEESIGQAVMAAAHADVQRLLRRAVHSILKEISSLQLAEVIQVVFQNCSQAGVLATEAYSPLVTWIKDMQAVFSVEPGLDDDSYGIVMVELWDVVLLELLSAISGQHQGKHDLFKKLYDGLMAPSGLLNTMMSSSLEMANLRHDAFSNKTLERVKHVLLVEGCPSSHLMAFHYAELMTYAEECGSGRHGHIQVVVQHTSNTIRLEVRSAKKLTTVDGVCNSYVMVQFHPASFFDLSSATKSQPIVKRTSPIYDFKMTATLAPDVPEYAVAVVTVMHSLSPRADDVLLGQAVLPLSMLRNAQDGRQSRLDVDLLLCSGNIMHRHANVFLHALVVLRRRTASDIAAATLAAVVEKTMDMAASSAAMQERM